MAKVCSNSCETNRLVSPIESLSCRTKRAAMASEIGSSPENGSSYITRSGSRAMARRIALASAARWVRQLNDSMGLTSLFVSHELEQTFAISDHVIILANGKIAAQGTPDEVRRSTDPLVYQYVNALSDGPVRFHYPGPTIEQDFGLGVAP